MKGLKIKSFVCKLLLVLYSRTTHHHSKAYDYFKKPNSYFKKVRKEAKSFSKKIA